MSIIVSQTSLILFIPIIVTSYQFTFVNWCDWFPPHPLSRTRVAPKSLALAVKSQMKDSGMLFGVFLVVISSLCLYLF